MSSTLVVAAVAFVRDGQVLTVRKQGTTRFMLPGGKLEPGETAAEAAAREVREEIGLETSDLQVLGEFTAAAANEPGLWVSSSVFRAELTGEPVASGEIAELRWRGLDEHLDGRGDDLAPLLREHVLPALHERD